MSYEKTQERVGTFEERLKRIRARRDENQMRDSGWSASIAADCDTEEVQVLREQLAAERARADKLAEALRGTLKYMQSKMPSNWQYNSHAETALAALSAHQYVVVVSENESICRMTDAALIAAAPELYAELKHLVGLLEPMERSGLLNTPGLATLNGARQALAKAKGA